MQYRTSAYAWGVFDNFFFEKNLFGDIVAIYNEAGTKIGSYKYDAWGACAVSVESTASTLEKKVVRYYNPFRYRGYYYDTETGYYYLQSRYYNPQWGRFLNADGYINANGDLIGFNMYAYCSNNPVMYTDPSGEWSKIYDYFFKAGEKIASLCSPEFLIACSEFFEDAKNFNIFNDDEQEVLNSEYFSCYKGSLVIRHSSSDISSFAVFGMIILNRNKVDATTVKHEWGHNVQEKILGPAYLLLVAAPSVIYCATGDYLQETDGTKRDRMYFSKIWERTADFFGGVDRKNYDPFFRFDNFVPW